jgi:hypothetical protein
MAAAARPRPLSDDELHLLTHGHPEPEQMSAAELTQFLAEREQVPISRAQRAALEEGLPDVDPAVPLEIARWLRLPYGTGRAVEQAAAAAGIPAEVYIRAAVS